MYSYLSFVIILSVSSSNSFSNASIWLFTFGTSFKFSEILSSFSNNLIAKNLFCASGTSDDKRASVSSMIVSTFSLNLCAILFSCLLSASLTALSASSFIPFPFKADISTTSQPNFSLSLSIWILSPFFSTISIILTAIITGIPSSIICVERYKFLSIFVPSTILMIASGTSLIR